MTTSLQCWNDIIKRGRKTSTYKIAMGFAISKFVREGKTQISRLELAETFLDLYEKRLKNGMPQLSSPTHQAVMETIVDLVESGSLSRKEAVGRVSAQAFTDVIPSFHTVDGSPVSVRFFEAQGSGIVITQNAQEIFRSQNRDALLSDLDRAWSDLETSFAKNRALRHSRVWVSTIGLRQRTGTPWCVGDIGSKAVVLRGSGISRFAAGISNDLKDGRKVALGFGFPLWTRVPEVPVEMTSKDRNVAWRMEPRTRPPVGVASGFVDAAWVLKSVRSTAPKKMRATLDIGEFTNAGKDLLLWEALPDPYQPSNAEAAVHAFFGGYSQAVSNSWSPGDDEVGTVFSLIGASLMWAGYDVPPDVLKQRCFVVGGAGRNTGYQS